MNDIIANQDKTAYQAEIFKNRLQKQYKTLRKWAKKEHITAYRLYDRDIPEIPLAVDYYELLPFGIESKVEAVQFLSRESEMLANGDRTAFEDAISRRYIHIALYERPYEKDEKEEEQWLEAMAQACTEVFSINKSNVITKTRKKLDGTKDGKESGHGRSEQYEKIESSRKITGSVLEQGELFEVNLSEYLDTGLFFDHRPLRKTVRDKCAKKSVLNLFCYTGSFSVYAAEGKAKRVESVDMSNTYLDWAKRNFLLNGFIDSLKDTGTKYIFTRSDVISFLNQKCSEKATAENRYDIIILDPPTFSNSKKTAHTLDINRDWSDLVSKCVALLNDGGTLYFSTNSRRLSFDESLIKVPEGKSLTISDITSETIPQDYRNAKIHRCWQLDVK